MGKNWWCLILVTWLCLFSFLDARGKRILTFALIFSDYVSAIFQLIGYFFSFVWLVEWNFYWVWENRTSRINNPFWKSLKMLIGDIALIYFSN
jgi:hypothetical protein